MSRAGAPDSSDSELGPLDLEEELRRTNPKGCLWEACATRGLAPPRVRRARVDARHRAEMRLAVEEWELDSGVHWGWSAKVAEHLAARALLEELEALEQEHPELRPTLPRAGPREDELGDDVFEVDGAEPARRRTNPKGQLYEWCQRQKPPVRRPRFEARRGAGGRMLVRAALSPLKLRSPWFAATRRKDAEHAAAEALLALLPASTASSVEAEAEAPDAETNANPRTVLNEMVQHGELAECRVEVVDRRGPAHAPVFTARGWAVFHDGERVEVEPVEGASKRAALTQAAAVLLEAVRQGDEPG